MIKKECDEFFGILYSYIIEKWQKKGAEKGVKRE
jgi:hypothetical protein